MNFKLVFFCSFLFYVIILVVVVLFFCVRGCALFSKQQKKKNLEKKIRDRICIHSREQFVIDADDDEKFNAELKFLINTNNLFKFIYFNLFSFSVLNIFF